MTPRPFPIEECPRLAPFFRDQQHPLCAYSLPALAVWRSEGFQPLAGVDGDILVVGGRFTRRPGDRHMLLPLAGGRDFSPGELHRMAGDLDFEHIWFVPAPYLARHGRPAIEKFFRIRPQPAYHDYVYRRRDLAGLEGGRYSGKRNLVRQFERRFVAEGRVREEPLDGRRATECIEFLERWCAERSCDLEGDEDLRCEWEAAVNALTHFDRLEVDGLLLRVDDRISAFGIGAGLTADMGVLHFEKALAGIKGLYQYFDRLCARRLFEGYDLINKESDMGVAGLRRAKRSYHPAMLVESFVLTRK